eukprot:Plantae.Rhodophyta-Purpureofilum_apyrenoidigerum.ctg38887.p1 GENE.Plantae.Rhodophyta-Purpureofilum_apyrenoidigerum.ctg38887~~Plantae.Rhodophyta-Purpureofilum_apyrenoidigerum.ctg38887.p1  ORF type:complete len:209 (+),score=25.21 Plantae.Rhodophyta-Purpureofilum_apyrenoidigerum.ctg38887:86-628(+)
MKVSASREPMKPVVIGKGLFQCPVKGCGKKSNRKHNVQMHLRRHTKEKPFRCRFVGCTMAFGWKSSLNQHEKLHEKDGDMREVETPEMKPLSPLVRASCSPSASSSDTLHLSEVSHLTLDNSAESSPRRTSSMEEEEFYCEVLVVGVQRPEGLIICSHLGCGKLFNNERDLSTHRTIASH